MRVEGFQTRENLINFVASQKIKECCKDSVLLTGNEEDWMTVLSCTD